MELGDAKTSGKDVDEEIGGEIDGSSAIEGGRRRGHQKALWKKRKREREGGEDGDEVKAQDKAGTGRCKYPA